MKRIIIFILSIFLLTGINANYAKAIEAPKEVNANEDKWVELQAVIIPFDLTVNAGTTTKGNQKYWFTIKDIGDVSLSSANYKKYSTKSEYIELVKWQKGNKYRYTTRAKGKDNVDLTKLFQK